MLCRVKGQLPCIVIPVTHLLSTKFGMWMQRLSTCGNGHFVLLHDFVWLDVQRFANTQLRTQCCENAEVCNCKICNKDV